MAPAVEDLPIPHQVLETVRSRTTTLARGLDAYYRHAFSSAPVENFENTGLPSWPGINTALASFQTTLRAFEDFLNDRDLREYEATGARDGRKRLVMSGRGVRREVLNDTVVYVNGKFPQAGFDAVSSLLGKKLDPAVAAWLKREEAMGREIEDGIELDGETVDDRDFVRNWNWAAEEGQAAIRRVFLGETEEILGEDEGDEEEEDDDEDEIMGEPGEKGQTPVTGVSMPLESMLRYMSSGTVPGH